MSRFLQTALAGAAIAALGLANPIQGQLVSVSPNCDTGNVLMDFNPDATDCLGAFAGNDKNFESDIAAAISGEGWGTMSYLGASDDAGSGPFTSNMTGSSGTLAFDSPLNGDFVLILKASNQFSLYYFAGLVDVAELYYVTAGTSTNSSGTAQGNSHASLWGGGVSVPEPASAMLMLTGLVGMATLRRRRERDGA